MIRFNDLKKSYKGNAVLKGLNLTIPDGEIFGFIGKNGSGKSTTMNILCGLLPKDSGDIYVNDEAVSIGKFLSIGYLPESPVLIKHMNAYEYLDYISACCNYTGDKKSRINELLTLVSLKDAANRRLGGYSRGMQQRIALAAALFNNPEIIVLDEPTSALDPEGRADIMDIIKKLGEQGKTVLFSTHILADVERVCTHVGILSGGTIIKQGSVAQLISEHDSNTVFVNLKSAIEGIDVKIKSLPFVSSVFYHQTNLAIDLVSSAHSRDLFEFLASEHCDVSSFNIKKVCLEEIYLKAVNDNEQKSN